MSFNILKYTLLSFLLLITSLNAYADAMIDGLFHNANDPIIGNPRGTITVVEFFDYQCGHCATMVPKLAAIIKADPNVKVILKDYPIRSNESYYASQAALAAKKQGKYNQLYYALFATNRFLSNATVLDIAKQQGLNISQLKKDMASPAVENQLAQTNDLANVLGIPGTPVLFIGKSNAIDTKEIMYIPGEISLEDLQGTIKKVEQQ